MNKGNDVELRGPAESADPLSEMLRQGTRDLIQQAVEAKRAEYKGRRLKDGQAAVVRNGHHPERDVQTGIGPVTVPVPNVRSRDGSPLTFRSALVPP